MEITTIFINVFYLKIMHWLDHANPKYDHQCFCLKIIQWVHHGNL